MNGDLMTVRRKVAVELGVIAVLTTAFLLLFPRRNPIVDVGLAGFALLCIAVSARYTKRVIWAATPMQPAQNRFSQCVKVTLWITVPTVLVFLLVGGILAFSEHGWAGVSKRILNWKLLAVFAAYLGWALMQQTLFQFYLLGRLLALFPRKMPVWPVWIIGFGFSLVRLPDIPTALVTAVAGVVWTVIYFRFRCLLPLAISHAALGTAFYYWVCGHDLAQEWSTAVSRMGIQP
jgi:hypothetical protein